MPYNPYAYQMPTYYSQPMPDNLTQLRQGVGYQSPMMQQPTAQTAQAAPSIIWVQGEEGAKAYMVAAGNSVLLMDSENSAFYIKSTDASGMPLPLRVFDYKERTTAAKMPPQTAQQLGGSLSPGQSLTPWQPAVQRWKSRSPQKPKRRSSDHGKFSF